MNTKRYPTDLSNSQWMIIQEFIPAAKSGRRPRSLEMREVVNAILYIVVGRVQWRMLPKEYPRCQSVYWYFTVAQVGSLAKAA
jgi:transposase